MPGEDLGEEGTKPGEVFEERRASRLQDIVEMVRTAMAGSSLAEDWPRAPREDKAPTWSLR